MKKKNIKTLIITAISLLLNSCNNKQGEFSAYLDNKFKYQKGDSCYIDLTDFFKIDYDTMYVFGAYSQVEGVRSILGNQNYNNSNIMMPRGFLVEDSQNKIILIKGHKIVYDQDVSSPYLYNGGHEVQKDGFFDGEKYTYYAKVYSNSKLLVVRKKIDGIYQYSY